MMLQPKWSTPIVMIALMTMVLGPPGAAAEPVSSCALPTYLCMEINVDGSYYDCSLVSPSKTRHCMIGWSWSGRGSTIAGGQFTLTFDTVNYAAHHEVKSCSFAAGGGCELPWQVWRAEYWYDCTLPPGVYVLLAGRVTTAGGLFWELHDRETVNLPPC